MFRDVIGSGLFGGRAAGGGKVRRRSKTRNYGTGKEGNLFPLKSCLIDCVQLIVKVVLRNIASLAAAAATAATAAVAARGGSADISLASAVIDR